MNKALPDTFISVPDQSRVSPACSPDGCDPSVPIPLTEAQTDEIRGAIRESLEKVRDGSVANTLQNCVIVLENDPLLKGAVRRNLLTGCVDIFGEMPWNRESTRLSDRDIPFILLLFERYYGIRAEKKVLHALEIASNRSGYHPIQEHLLSLKWDGVPRVKDALHHFLGAEKGGDSGEYLRLFMHGAAERVFHPGCKFELMLSLTGGQGAGKSTFFRFLAIRDEWFSDDLKKLDDENIYRKLQGKWILELSEMVATANARSIEDIKAFLSRGTDNYKVPYDRYPEDHPRQCVFAGSSNRQDFLPMDRSGNRRFLPVEIHPENAETHILQDEAASRAYIGQMWAEIMAERAKGAGKIWLSKQEEQRLHETQTAFMQEDSTAGVILGFIDSCEGTRLCTRLLYQEALGHEHTDPKPWEAREISEIVTNAIASGELTGWQAYRGSRMIGKYGKQRGWERVPTAKQDRQSGQNARPAADGYVQVNVEDLPDAPPWN